LELPFDSFGPVFFGPHCPSKGAKCVDSSFCLGDGRLQALVSCVRRTPFSPLIFLFFGPPTLFTSYFRRFEGDFPSARFCFVPFLLSLLSSSFCTSKSVFLPAPRLRSLLFPRSRLRFERRGSFIQDIQEEVALSSLSRLPPSWPRFWPLLAMALATSAASPHSPFFSPSHYRVGGLLLSMFRRSDCPSMW